MIVSVVIPIFNSEEYIQDCLDNLEKQTFRDFEVIFVVDGRTTDNSVQIIKSHETDSMKIVIQDDDDRVGGARNIGLDNANGDYLWFLDVDDIPRPIFLETMVGLIERENADYVCCNLIYCHSEISSLPEVKSVKTEVMSGVDAVISMNAGKISPNVWDKLYRTSFVRGIGIRFEKEYSEDYDFVTNLCLKSNKIVYTNEPLYYYNIENEGRSSGNGNKICSSDVAIFEKYRILMEKEHPEKYPEFCKQSVKHLLHSMTLADRETFKQLSSKECIKDSLKYCNNTDPEFLIFKISPGLYYRIGMYFRRRRYAKGSRLFYSK